MGLSKTFATAGLQSPTPVSDTVFGEQNTANSPPNVTVPDCVPVVVGEKVTVHCCGLESGVAFWMEKTFDGLSVTLVVSSSFGVLVVVIVAEPDCPVATFPKLTLDGVTNTPVKPSVTG
jgi:hypothetical protein